MSHSSSIPAHYSDRYINQRYNKALYIIQHLPSSSHVQPAKEQKLELYSYYKQVSQGDINTQRPGIFDVVGRAKWDAWKKLEGMSELEAKHRYVEILLQVAMEAYKKPAGRAQAHQIIQSFAVMQPAGDSGDSSSEEEEEGEDEDDSSVGSEDAEEQAYLRQVEKSIPTNTISSRRHQPPPPPILQRATTNRPWRNGDGKMERSSSRASSQHSGHMSMMTAPSELRRLSQSSSSATSVNLRPVSVASNRSSNNNRKNINTTRPLTRELYGENFDDSVNPWDLSPSARQYKIDLSNSNIPTTASTSRPNSTQPSEAGGIIYRSPLSPSSSVTATQYNNSSVATESYALGRHHSSLEPQQQVQLGPATKRALESIQHEIEALNERISGLRKEIVERDLSIRKSSSNLSSAKKSSSSSSLPEDGWRWVFKAAMRHAVMNLMTACILFLILYKNQSPIAHVILRIIRKYWQKFKRSILISKAVV